MAENTSQQRKLLHSQDAREGLVVVAHTCDFNSERGKGEDQKLKVTFVDMASLRQHETLVSKKEKEVGFVYTYL